MIEETIEKERIECDFWRGKTWSCFMDDVAAVEAQAGLQEYIEDGADVSHIDTFSLKEAAEVCCSWKSQ